MPKLVHLKDGTRLSLSDTSFASGGEGDLYRILHPPTYSDQIVKIYKPDKQTPSRQRKIEYLVAHPPVLQKAHGHHAVIWMSNLVYENQRFIGFLMPIAKGEKLEFLCHAQLPKHLGPEWQKFDFRQPKAWEVRSKICFNIAVALYEIHSLGSYVLVDMKPENIIIQSNGLISIIDMDSVEVMEKGTILFPAPVATPEYSPPEFYRGVKPEKVGASETWDRFSMAVIFYRLLTGIHPFTGSCKSPFDKCNGLADMVENGLFPYGKKAQHFHIIPPPHSHFKKLRKEVQQLFIRCFEVGHTAPQSRPSAEEWCQTLSPKPIMLGRRAMPSSHSSLALPFASLPLPYPVPKQLPSPSGLAFLKIREPDVLDFLVKAFVGNSPKHALREKIEQQQEMVKKTMGKKAPLDQALQQLHKRFTQKQDFLLQQEKEKVEQLQKIFEEKMLSLDQSAITLHEKEKKELQKAHLSITNQISLEKEQVVMKRRWEYLEASYSKKSQEINLALQQLEREEKAYQASVLQPDQHPLVNPSPPHFEERRKVLYASRSTLQNHYHHDIQPLKEALTRYHDHKNRSMDELKSGQHTMLKQIEAKYDFLFSGLASKGKETERSLSAKAGKIKTETEKLLQENILTVGVQYTKLKKDVDLYLTEIDSQIKKLNDWQEEYKRW